MSAAGRAAAVRERLISGREEGPGLVVIGENGHRKEGRGWDASMQVNVVALRHSSWSSAKP